MAEHQRAAARRDELLAGWEAARAEAIVAGDARPEAPEELAEAEAAVEQALRDQAARAFCPTGAPGGLFRD
jgi:hypothetical protein